MKKNIPFYRYEYLYKCYGKKIIKIIDKVASAGRYIMQKELKNFEKNFAKFTNSKYCIGVSNATDGLQMLLMAGGIKKGDEILVSMHTMIATASAIHFTGAKPILLDIKESDYLIDEKKIEKKISSKTRAIIVTQLNGRVADMEKILRISKKYNLKIFEDSAQALGAYYKKKHAGTFGYGGCFSFYPAKILGCLGDGGAVITNNKLIYEKILALRDHGRLHNDIKIWGFNARLDNIEAATLDYLLKKVPNFIRKRRKLANTYYSNLKSVIELKLPPEPNKNKINYDSFQNYEVCAKDSYKLSQFLKKNNVGTLKQWGGKSLNNFNKLKMGNVDKKSNETFKNLLMLPMNISVSQNEVIYISNLIKKFYGYRAKNI